MKTLFIITLIFLFISCQTSPNLNDPESINNQSPNYVSKFSLTNDLYVSPEFEAKVYLLAENLNNPQGAVFYPPAKGLLITQSTESNIIRIKHQGEVGLFANIPYDNIPALIDLIYSPQHGTLVTSLRDGKIFQINKVGDVVEYVAGFDFPVFMELDNKHNLYVSELFANCITKVDQFKNKTRVIEFPGGYRWWQPRGIVFDYRENLYVLSGRTKEIMCINIKNENNLPIIANESMVIATVNESNSPQDLTIGMGGKIFVVGNNNIWVIQPQSGLVSDISLFATGLVGPFNTIHSNNSGDLIVVDYGAGKVFGISRTVFAIN